MRTPRRTQRWRDGACIMRPVEERGFYRRYFEVAELPDDARPKAFIESHHYSGEYPSALKRFGLFHSGVLCGAAVFSSGSNEKALTNPLPTLVPYAESMELGRLVLWDTVPSQGESYFVARAFELLRGEGIQGIVSFSDPEPRRTRAGQVVMPGHVGVVYQALKAEYLGRATPRSLWTLPDTTTIPANDLQKVRARKKGHAYVEAKLVKNGASPRRAGEDPKAWLRRAKIDAQVEVRRHPGNHRYAWLLWVPRKYWTFGIPSQSYPKAVAS